MLPPDDTFFMKKALNEAQQAATKGEVPVGVVVVAQGQIIARGHNLTETLNDVTAHGTCVDGVDALAAAMARNVHLQFLSLCATKLAGVGSHISKRETAAAAAQTLDSLARSDGCLQRALTQRRRV